MSKTRVNCQCLMTYILCHHFGLKGSNDTILRRLLLLVKHKSYEEDAV